MSISPILFLVSAAHFCNDFFMGFLSPLYPLIMEKFGLSLAMVGTVSMIAALSSALSQPLFGMLFDRFGFNSSLYLAPLLTALFVSCLGIAPSFPVFLVLLFLGCLGSAAFHPKGASVTPTLSGKHPELGMAIFSAGGNLGYAAGPAVIAFFITAWSFKATPVFIVPAALVALCLFLLLPARELRARTQGAARVQWRALLTDSTERGILLRLVFINFSLNVASRGLTTFLPVYLSMLSVHMTRIGLLFTAMLALGAVASIFVSALSRRTGKRALILCSAVGSVPLALMGVAFAGSPLGNVFFILSGTVLTFTNPLLILMAQKHSGNSPAMASSLIMGFSWGMAGLVMVPLGGIGEIVGMKWMLWIVGAFPALAALSCIRLPRE